MNKNENMADRAIRLVLGLGLALLAFVKLSGVVQIAGYIVAFILLFTGVTGFCLLYKLFNFSTLKSKEERPVEEEGEKEES